PIATTPPRRGWKEESLSRSSSETQASVTSGISLGEAIRQKTAVSWGIESWYQLPAEVDSSHLTAASETKLGLTCDRTDLTEFPTLEEGVMPSAEASGRRSHGDTERGLLLDLQDSQFSPHLPLLMYSAQGQRFSDETLLQQSEMDFIPLRGVPDVSGASEEHSKPAHLREAVSPTETEPASDAPGDSFTLSQHPLPFGLVEPPDAACSACFSGQTSFSVSEEAKGDCENGSKEGGSIPQARGAAANAASTASLTEAHTLSQTEVSPSKHSQSTSGKDERFSRDNHVPVAGFELSEKEKALMRLEESSASENSSHKPARTANSEESEGETRKGKVQVAGSVSEGCGRQLGRLGKEKAAELDLSNNLSDEAIHLKDNCKNSDAQGVLSAKASGAGEGTSTERGGDFNGLESLKLGAVAAELQGAVVDHQQKHLSPAAWFEREQFIPAVRSTGDCAPKQLPVGEREAPSHTGNTPGEVEPGVSRNELTISDFSIERGHKVTGISPSFNLVGDGSFSVHLAHPSYQSTPGILLKKNVQAEELGVLVIKSDAQASPSCLKEETSGSLSVGTASVEKQRSPQGAQKENDDRLEFLKLKYPHTGRIQSLPSLSFMEKVGTWNMSQSEEVSDAVTSCDPGGASPGRKTRGAIAGSSNDVLSLQKSGRDPGDDVAASSRETSSLRSSRFHNKSLFLVHPLTRSQSDNTVNVSTRNMTSVEVISSANSTEAAQPLEEKSHILEEKSPILGESPNSSGSSVIQKFTTEIVSGAHGEDAESTAQSSDPNGFVSGEGIAQLLGEDGNSPPSDHKNCDALENQSHNQNIPTGRVSMDNFSDISPDSLTLPVSYGESSQGGLSSSGFSSVVSRHFFPSAKDDDFIPVGATSLDTPEKEELNIEERIPIYLRNLGIEQSPGTILTPFLPRGPIREVEFSPSELRTLKDSTETLMRSSPQPQGKSLLAVETTQASFHFGTSALSSSVPTDSEPGSDVLSPHELSPCFSRSFGYQPVSRCSTSCHPPETTAPLAMQWEEEMVSGGESLKSSLAGVRNEMEVGRGSHALGVGSKRNKGQESGSLIGSGALEEIQKLLAEVRDLAGVWPDPVPPAASARETAESSTVLIRKEDGLEDSRLAEDNTPQLEKILSRDEPTTRRSLREERSVINAPNDNTRDLRWENPFDVGLHRSQEVLKEVTKLSRTGKAVGRSEPEGCSSVTADKNQPGFAGLAQSKGSSEVSTLRASELGDPSSSEPRGSIPDVAGAFQSSLVKGSVAASKVGGVQESDDSSSGDSLAARVQNLLRHSSSSEPLNSIPSVPGGFQSVLSKASAERSKAGGLQENDDSSSGDSLAARVKNLLRNGSPVVHTAPALKSTGEEERKSRVWLKLKLTSQSRESLSDWNEEDQQRIEEIKAELLLKAKKSTLAKEPQLRASEGASEYSRNPEQDVEPFKAPSAQRFQPDKHTGAVQMKELVEPSLGEAVAFHRADPPDCCLLKETRFQSSSTVPSPVRSRRQTVATSRSGTAGEPHPPLQQDTRAVRSAAASDGHTEVHLPAQKKLSMDTCSEDGIKQITSITFSSRKRLRSPLASMALSDSPGDGLDGIMPLEADSASTEEESHDKQHWERSKTCPPSLAGSVSSAIASPDKKDGLHHVSVDKDRAGAYQGTDCLSAQGSVSIRADERQTLSAKNWGVLPQDVPELGRPSVGLGCDTSFSQETNRCNELQEKSSPPRHVQLCESLAASDPAVQTGLLKGHLKLVEEEKKSPSHQAPLRQEEVAREQSGTSGRSPTYEMLSTTSVSPSLPTKKVLSCVHITLSSKCNNSELQRDVSTEHEQRSRDKPEVHTQPTSLKTPEAVVEAVAKAPAADLMPGDQKSSSLPSPASCTAGQEVPLQSSERPQVTALASGGWSLKKAFNSGVPTKTGTNTSDATTQITTESPEKITFSAEIYVNSQVGQNTVPQSSLQRARELPNNTTSSLDKISSFTRQGDQPILLPYKPSGSAGLYYVPYLKPRPRTPPLLVSFSAGSDDALPPRSPANVLGLRDGNPPDTTASKNKEGIYSQRARPKLAWAEEQMMSLEASSGRCADHSKPLQSTQPAFASSWFYLRGPTPTCESSFPSNSELSEDSCAGGPARASSSAVLWARKKPHRHQRDLSVHHKKGGDNKFFLLAAEADHSRSEDLNSSTSPGNRMLGQELLHRGRREAEQKAARSSPPPCDQRTRLHEAVEKDRPLRQRTHSRGSLDELWVKFLECQKRHQHRDFRSSGELSLVERLDRLARVLQNPIKHTLIPTRSERSLPEMKTKGREQKKIRLPEKSLAGSTSDPHATHLEERPRITQDKNIFVELRKTKSGEKTIAHVSRILEHHQDLETPSATSSEARLSGEHGTTISSTASEWDAATQTELGSATRTEVSSSGSVSTIDTARLIRAFGHERVRLAPRLSQLYWAIDHQKSRSEKWEEGTGKAAGVGYPKGTSERHRKRKEIQVRDSPSASSSSWGPSSALSNKRRTRMLNKGIQAGDLEIVNSATKKNTRDVGLTFPTPGSRQPNQRLQEPWRGVGGIFGESDGMVTDHQSAGSEGKQKDQPGNFFVEKRMKRTRLRASWFVQEDDLKSESRKENHSNSFCGPGPSWFEPWSSAKPWREPLREKNWQEQQRNHTIQAAVAEGAAESGSSRPFVKLTLQEALAVHRPDFISRSGERVKHLKLVMEERRIQSVLQAQREELLDPPEKRKGSRSTSHM
ncbi:ALMS1 protein, partial [Halcyon senegalensis]|nr:ALMS1 protein [Halcyon senegalensis]